MTNTISYILGTEFHTYQIIYLFTSVADQGCLSSIPDPDFYPSRIPDLGSRIPDPKSATKERGEKNSCHTFFWSHKFYKIENYFTFYPNKLLLSSQKYGFGIQDPGTEIRDPEKTHSRSCMDPGVKKAPDPGSGSATLLFKAVSFHFLWVI